MLKYVNSTCTAGEDVDAPQEEARLDLIPTPIPPGCLRRNLQTDTEMETEIQKTHQLGRSRAGKSLLFRMSHSCTHQDLRVCIGSKRSNQPMEQSREPEFTLENLLLTKMPKQVSGGGGGAGLSPATR